jgi:hypothetical protein
VALSPTSYKYLGGNKRQGGRGMKQKKTKEKKNRGQEETFGVNEGF